MVGAAGGPAPTAVARAAEPERHSLSPISEAGEIAGVSVGAECDRGIAAEVVGAGAGDGGIIRERGDAGNETVGQRGRPRFAAVERGVHAAAVVVIPVVVAGDHVRRIRRVDREGRLVLGGGIAANVDDVDRGAVRGSAEAGGAGRSRGGWGFVGAGGDERAGKSEDRIVREVTHLWISAEGRERLNYDGR